MLPIFWQSLPTPTRSGTCLFVEYLLAIHPLCKTFHVEHFSNLRNVPRGTFLRFCPLPLLVPNCPITFMEHKRCVVHIARQSAEAMQEFMGRALPIDMDTVIAGA